MVEKEFKVIPAYITSEEKKENFKEVKFIKNVPELETFWEENITRLKPGIWRGVSDSSFMMFTSAQREKIESNGKFNFENYLRKAMASKEIKNFLDLQGVPHEVYPVQGFLQHYKGFSTLLDFTRDPEAAVFFMLNSVDRCKSSSNSSELKNYMSLYFIEDEALVDLKVDRVEKSLVKMKELMHTNLRSYASSEEELSRAVKSSLSVLVDTSTEDVFLLEDCYEAGILNRVRNNIRIANQQGLFLVNKNPDLPLEKSLRQIFQTNWYSAQLDVDMLPDEREQLSEDIASWKRIRDYYSKPIIHSFEFHVDLIGAIKEKIKYTNETIYPNPEKIVKDLSK